MGAPPRAILRGPTPATSVLTLLHAIARGRRDLSLASFSGDQVRWALATGLGAWLKRCTADDPGAERSALWPLVHGADLTARVLVAEQMDAVEEILADCAPHAPPLTLLKGISICDQYYPEPHLRTMGDIDLLVDDRYIGDVDARLRTLGYRPDHSSPPTFYDTHHHLRPLIHPRHRVWVELHRGLFPASSHVGRDRVFDSENVRAELVPSTFRGRRVNRLSDELQLIYLAAHWAFGMKRVRGLIGIVDVMQLMVNALGLDRDRVLTQLQGSLAASHVYLLLTYLRRHRLADVDTELVRGVSAQQRSLGPATLRALHVIIDQYVVTGGPSGRLINARNVDIAWSALLSPERPSRNVLALTWNLLPSRRWFTRALGR